MIHLSETDIPLDWTYDSIENGCIKVTSGGTPSRKNKNFYINGVIPWVKTKELEDGYIQQTEESITHDAINNSSAKILPGGTILLAMYGATVGMLGITQGEMACNQACCALITDSETLDKDFLFYFLLSNRKNLINLATGAAQQNISGALIKEIAVPRPDIIDQRKIGKVLRTLDDKIELNQKMNQTLEEIAKAIFKSWFVDFDPVRAKAEGRPTELPPEISDLFPDALVDSEIGEIPKGWNIVPFECLVDFKNGYAFKSKELSSEIKTDFAVFKMGHIKVGGGFNETYKTDFLTSEISPKMKRSILKTGDVLMCMTDMKSNVRLLGHTALFFDQETEYLVNQRVGLIRAKEDASNYPFLYCLTNENKFLSEIRRNANSGVQVNLSTSGIKNTPTVYPGIEIMRKFGSLMIPIFERIFLSKRENKTLSELRDTLLPKLISGELRIPDAEKFLEEAGI
jgi:type I restriction enzyme S subunit